MPTIRAAIIASSLSFQFSTAIPHPAKAFVVNGGPKSYPSILVSPSFHTSNETAVQVDFTTIALKGEQALGRDILNISGGDEVQSFHLTSKQGVTFISPNGTVGGDDKLFNKLWAVTYPLFCGNTSTTERGPEFFSLEFETEGRNKSWMPHKAVENSIQSNLTADGRYLGEAFSIQRLAPSFLEATNFTQNDSAYYSSTLYMLGGTCLREAEPSFNVSGSRFSKDIWKVSNSSVSSSTNGDMILRFANNTAPPPPAAGFTATDLPPRFSVDGSQSVLMLGGYTADMQLIDFNRVALYNLPSETWAYLVVDTSGARIADARAGHTAVISKNGTRIVIFGGWVGDINIPADPPLLVLEIGASQNEWKLTAPTPGNDGEGPPSSLWGHAAAMLYGDVMLITSGFITSTGRDGDQDINKDTYYYNLTSNSWIYSYTTPKAHLAASPQNTVFGDQNLAILASVVGGLLGITTVVCFLVYLSRKKYSVYNKLSKPRRVRRRDGTVDIDSDAGLMENHGNGGSLVSRPPRSRYTYRSRSDDTDPLRIYTRNLRFARHMARQEEIKENARLQQELLENEKQERDVAAWLHRWAELDASSATAGSSSSTIPPELTLPKTISNLGYQSDHSASTQKIPLDFTSSEPENFSTIQSSSENSSWPVTYPSSSVYSSERQVTNREASTLASPEQPESPQGEHHENPYTAFRRLLSTPQQAYQQFAREPCIVVTAPSCASENPQRESSNQEQSDRLTRGLSNSSGSSFASIFSRFELDKEIINLNNNDIYDCNSLTLTPSQRSVLRGAMNYDSLRANSGSRSNVGPLVRHGLYRSPSSNYGSCSSASGRQQLAPIPSQSPELPASPRLRLQTVEERQGPFEVSVDGLSLNKSRTYQNLAPREMQPGITISPPPGEEGDGNSDLDLDLEDYPQRIRMGSFSIFEGQFEHDEQISPLVITKRNDRRHGDVVNETKDADCLSLPRRRRSSQQPLSSTSASRSLWGNMRSKHLRRKGTGFSPRLELRQNRHNKNESGGSSSSGGYISWPVTETLTHVHAGIPVFVSDSGTSNDEQPQPCARPAAGVAGGRSRSLSSSIKRPVASIISRGKSWSSGSSSTSSSSKERRRKRRQQRQQQQTQLNSSAPDRKGKGKMIATIPTRVSERISRQSLSPNAFFRDTLESGSMLDGEDFENQRVVQVMFTAPRGPLRIVNASPLTVRNGSHSSSIININTAVAGANNRVSRNSSLGALSSTRVAEQMDEQTIQEDEIARASRVISGAYTPGEGIKIVHEGMSESWKTLQVGDLTLETGSQKEGREHRELERRLRYGLGIGFAV